VSGGAARRPPTLLALVAGGIVALLLLPLAYLLLRVASDFADAVEILGERGTWRLVLNTIVLVIGVVTAAVLVGVPLAWLVTRSDLPGRRLWATAGALPLVIPSYVAALCLLSAHDLAGWLPEVTGYWGALLALTLATYPYVFLLARGALLTLDPSLEEAARGLGVTRARAVASVTLPTLRPAVGVGALLAALYTLSDFGVVSLMRYDALTSAIYLQYKSLFDRTPAATLALLLVGLTAIALVLEYRTRQRGRLYRTGPGAARRAAPVRLGAWTAPALAFCTLVTGLFLVLPTAVLCTWLWRGIANERELAWPWHAALDSLTASSLAAVVTVAAAIPVALLAVRYPSRRTHTLERLAYAGNALPGLVVALSLVFVAARYASPVYQTLGLLVFAYAVRFFPQALSGAETTLQQVSPRVEEAARALGRGPLSTLVHVTVPLARSGLVAGATLVFLSTMKELPATLLLRPIGFDTLATEIWKLTQIGAYSRAAVPALALIVVSLPVLWLLSGERAVESTGAG
jgi:iron(III) transport system permease protein